MSDDNITPFPIKPRPLGTERVFQVVTPTRKGCSHDRFIVDESLEQVECRDCGERLNPIYALLALARRETQYHAYHVRYHDEMQRLSKRQKTKCQHCGQITRISER